MRGTSLALLESYLSSRKRCVSIDQSCSTFQYITCGIPRGSILGHVLFNVYINGIVNISENAKCIIYADDTSLLISAPDINVIIAAGNTILEKLHLGSQINRLKINSTESKAAIFRPKNKCVICDDTLKIGSSEIDIVGRHKILGIVVSEYMQ